VRQFSNIVSVNLPDLGEGTKEATIKTWFVKPGDRVEEVSNIITIIHICYLV
jgi:pyruvate/2-oxoglutarate dehydrogenase complex dihydrolipoamide acyltransferase (E2) component